MIRSVRFRVTAVATVVVAAVLGMASVGLVVNQRRVLTENLDEGLSRTADTIVAESGPALVPAALGDDDAVAQVVPAGGGPISASARLEGEPPIAAPPAAGETAVESRDDLPQDPGTTYRVLSRTVEPPRGPPYVIHVAANADDITESTGTLVGSLLIAFPAAVVALAALIWWLVGRTLAPVEAVRSSAAEIGGSDLHRRLPEPGTRDEVDRLAETLNAMIARIEASTERQRQFVADASHELRSPLTRIRSELEVDAAHPETADLAATHRSVLDETVAVQGLVDDLLLLARSDAGAVPAESEPVNLDLILHDQARGLADRDGLVVDVSGIEAGSVSGHAGQLARAVGNVVDNAALHARHRVELRLDRRGGKVVLAVADDGPGIPADQRERVFERFTRLDQSRTATTGGAGLGLAIARDIVERHGGTIAVDPDRTTGARVVITLPFA